MALALFAEHGFAACTMADVAEAAGVSRRTVFRLFASKNEMVWGDFAWVRRRLQGHLEEGPASEPLGHALRRAVLLSNRYDAAGLAELRTRMTLVMTTPALQAYSVLRYAEWQADVAAYVARRTGGTADDLAPRAVAQATMAAAMSAFGFWVDHPGAVLQDVLDDALTLVVVPMGNTAG